MNFCYNEPDLSARYGSSSSSQPPLFLIREEGGSTAIPVGPAVSLVDIPPLPQDIAYMGATSIRQYTVPEIPLPDDSLSFLGGRTDNDVPLLPLFLFCVFIILVLI